MHEAKGSGMPLHQKILIGMCLGAGCGITVHYTQESLEAWLSSVVGYESEIVQPLLTNVIEPVGKVFLNLLLMTVIPLVFASLATGVANLGDLRKLGRMGARTFAYFVLSMTLAVTIGLTLVNSINPGSSVSDDVRDRLMNKYGKDVQKRLDKAEPFSVNTFVNIVPRNPLEAAVRMDMLAVIFVALLVGAGLTIIQPERARLLVQVLEGVNDLMVFVIGLAMRLAPYGVFAFLFSATANFGFELLKPLGLYVVVVLGGLGLQMFVSFPIMVKVFSGLNPIDFFRKVRIVIITAFSTSSSNATLPTSIKVSEEELGVPPQVAGFVLPLGATMNMNGTALFEGVTVVFLAQVFGVHLDLGAQLIVIVMSVITAIGAAGVPGGSLPLLAMILAQNNIPPEGLAIILGIDRLLDMCRTTLNVVGDICAATYVARAEGFELTPLQKDPHS